METNLTARYLAIETERTRFPKQTQRGWLVEQAAADGPRQPGTASVRRWVGAALIHVGQRLQGVSIMEITPKATV